jgi:Uma2 family endonuclease
MLKINSSEAGFDFNQQNHAPLPYIPNLYLPFIHPGGIKHQAVSLRIAAAMLLYAESGNLGHVIQAPCNVMLSREFIMQPDIFFIGAGRSGLICKTILRGAPDVIIEILSQDTREKDLRTKRRIYAQFEVKEYWIVDPDNESVEVLLWSELGYATLGIYGRPDRLSSPILPKLRLPLRKVFK